MAAAASENICFEIQSVIRGHHVYKEIWTPFIGEKLHLEQEFGNRYDHCAVIIKKEVTTVGRVPRNMSMYFWNFLGDGGAITCFVTGKRRKGVGLEVPCSYRFCGSKQQICKISCELDKLT